jgi:hypothetical protein
MELFIQIRDGQPHEHPIFGDNFCEAFPHIDVGNLPPEFAQFVRVPKPVFEVQDFKVVGDSPVYEWGGGVVQDVWSVRDMTEAEKQTVIDVYASLAATFVFDVRQNAIKELELAVTDAQKAAWQEYINMLETYVVKDVFKPSVPAPPRLDANGNPMSLNDPGSAPNVVG